MSHTSFVGAIPEFYDRHLGPVLFEPFAVDLERRISGNDVLEVASGTGIATRRILAALPAGAKLTATDLNQPMLDYARRVVKPDTRLTWTVADAQQLPFSDAAFDTVVCQFGAMFFPDKPRAFAEFRRVLRTGGRLLFSVWNQISENRFAAIANDTIAQCFPSNPPAFYQTPFGWADRDAIRATLKGAGFANLDFDTLRVESVASSAEHFAIGLVRGNPVSLDIQARGTKTVAEVEAAVRDALAKELGSSPCRVSLRVTVVSADG